MCKPYLMLHIFYFMQANPTKFARAISMQRKNFMIPPITRLILFRMKQLSHYV